LYSVEQLPRCDLLRLSPRLGDSSCRLDETPRECRRRGKSNTPRGTWKKSSNAAEVTTAAKATRCAGLRNISFPWYANAAWATRRAVLGEIFDSGGHDGDSNTPRGTWRDIRLRRSRRRKQHVARDLEIFRSRSTRMRRGQHAARYLEIIFESAGGHDGGGSNTPRGSWKDIRLRRSRRRKQYAARFLEIIFESAGGHDGGGSNTSCATLKFFGFGGHDADGNTQRRK